MNSEDNIKVSVIKRNGETKIIELSREEIEKSELSILELSHRYELELEGACEASCACSTCHVFIDASHLANLPPPTEEEEDMLDLVFSPQPTSRLGCQVKIKSNFDGATITIPGATRNLSSKEPID